MNEYNSHWPTQEQHSLYRSPRQLKHSLQHEQFFRSHLQDCVSMHLLTTLAHTASLQLFTASIKYKVAIATMNTDTHLNILLRPGTKKKSVQTHFWNQARSGRVQLNFHLNIVLPFIQHRNFTHVLIFQKNGCTVNMCSFSQRRPQWKQCPVVLNILLLL
jgi:hypothetical protein